MSAIDPKALEAAANAIDDTYDVDERGDMTNIHQVATAAITAYHKHLADAGSVIISLEWLEAVLAYANPIGVMGDHTFAEIRAMIAAHGGAE
jgi:microcystin degradation protein MlrC